MNFTNGAELIELCIKHNKPIHEIMIEKETKYTGITEDEILNKLMDNYNIMRESVSMGIEQEVRSISGLIGGEGKKIFERNEKEKSVCGSLMSNAISRSMAVLEVNSAMGKIVAAPTAGSAGILPGVLITIGEEFNFNDKDIAKALLTASAIGFIITRNATVSGAEGGCQAETGSAAAMAAGAVVELMGGTPEQSLDAASFTINNTLGLVCDPIAGLVEAPCQMRNGIGAANALICAEMALSGVKSIIPFDEVVDTMYRVGKSMPMELRETAMGGLAATPTGKRLMKEILENN